MPSKGKKDKHQFGTSSAPGSLVSSPTMASHPSGSAQGEAGLGPSEMQKLMEMIQGISLGQQNLNLGQHKMQQEMAEMKTELKKEFEAIKNDVKIVHQMAVDNKKGVSVVEEKADGLEREVGAVRRENQIMDNVIAAMNLERLAFYLRFQNVIEQEGEDLKEIMSIILAEFIGREKDQMWWDIDQVYRVNTNYARIHNVPREIHVKFLRRCTREEILGVQRGRPLVYGGREIAVLKQIPKKIRDIRRRYQFLSKKLYAKGVMFRWLMPEGMLVSWEGQKIKINNIEEANAFLIDHKTLLETEDFGATGGSDNITSRDRGREETRALASGEEGGPSPRRLRSKEKKGS